MGADDFHAEPFHWDQHFVTGLAAVDAQHHRLVDMINRLGRLLAGNQTGIADLDDLYGQLADYAVDHFREEERLMAAVALDPRHLGAHVAAHRSFLENASSIYAGVSAEGFLGQAQSLLMFLTHWLAYHILGMDQDMAKQIRAIRLGLSPGEAYDRLEQGRASETQPLLEALHGLFEEVSLQNRQLKQLNESLEEKVAQRTRELSEAIRSLEILSLTDALTGLPNRRHALQLLSGHWKEAVANDAPLVTLMIDADHFKQVNDACGHDAGDQVLVQLARTLRASLRREDVVCRLGGDEFFAICPVTDLSGGLQIAESIRSTVAELRVPTGGEPWQGSISVGVAARWPEMASYRELIKQADQGVYCAKEAGKNCVRIAQVIAAMNGARPAGRDAVVAIGQAFPPRPRDVRWP
ncbi:MAG: GGDEF domain-containing protein [Synechococcus sp.]|nr:GGDEF domain-containing protein [Synechococcus sp.]